ncbi:MAG: CHAT domain-containing protein [Planctomycetota bacterium]
MPNDTPTKPLDPTDAGIYEELARRLAFGELSAREALRQARAAAEHAGITTVGVQALTALGAMLGERGRWQHAVQVMRVLLEALDAAGDSIDPPTRHDAVRIWVEVAAAALCQVGDPRLHYDAVERGTSAVESALKLGDRPTAGRIAFSLGALYLDPYLLHHAVDHAERIRAQWEQHLVQGNTWDGERAPTSPAGEMPLLAESLRKAESWLRRAAELSHATERARVAKALLQVLAARSKIDSSVTVEQVAAAGRDAIEVYAQLNEPMRLIEILGHAQQAGVPLDRALLKRALAQSLDQLMVRIAPGDAATLFQNAAVVLRGDGAADEALALFCAAAPLLESHVRDEERAGWYAGERGALREAFQGGFVARKPGADIEEVWQSFTRESAVAQDVDPAQQLAVALYLAELSVHVDQEQTALAILERAASAAPLTASRHKLALDHLRAVLWANIGANTANAERLDESAVAYASGLSIALDVRDAALALRALSGLARVIESTNGTTLAALIAFLAPKVMVIETRLGESGERCLQDLVGAACLVALQKSPDARLLAACLELAKAWRFSSALSASAAQGYVDNGGIRSLRAGIDALLVASPEAETPVDDAMARIGNYLLISPPTRRAIALDGETPAERLANLRHRADVATEDALAARAVAQTSIAASQPGLELPLDTTTVVIELLLTKLQDSEVLVRLLRTVDGAHMSATRLGPQTARAAIGIDGVTVEMSEIGARVLKLRELIDADPAPGQVAHVDALERLASLGEIVLGDLGAPLAKSWERGARHICFVPHGPLHIAPLHLLPLNGRPLAESWLVTSLPAARMLALESRRASRVEPRARALTAVGLTFTASNLFGLEPLPNVASEIGTVAATMNGTALLNDEATEAAILAALSESRYVHIATHGVHDRAAAGYHTLFCAPSAAGDGRLHAFELLGCDLRGLELVTLSACETALARHDLGDNPRGIPAALLLSGVRAIVGTLWNLETNAAETFFAALYQQLSEGARSHDAFAAAQRTTRARHPEYRDWGAFYYLGDWR